MIVEFFIDLWEIICTWFLDLFGTGNPPSWLSDFGSFLAELVHRAAGLGAWFPFQLLGTVAGTYFVIWITLWLVKGVRWLWGLTPFSGGS
ncbi:hypothetical protein [Microbacterium sp.]|uniref:hypothetical protein n=1 Tax=Microbacterium sp. TaxID=51671 RepID=UPI0039E5A2A3